MTSAYQNIEAHRVLKRSSSKFLLAFLLSGIVFFSVQAEAADYTMGMGVAFAPIGGHGFSFRQLPETGIGFQFGTVFWKNSGNSYFNLGGELMYVLRQTRLTKLYIPAGIALTYDNQLYYRYDPSSANPNQEYRDTKTYVTGGAGLGFTARFKSWEDIWFSLDVVMAADRDYLGPLPQFAIHYFFR